MKHIPIIIASFLFSVLFFEKSIGLNLSIFSVVTIALLLFYNPIAFKKRATLWYALAYIVSAVFVFIQHSNLSIIANCIAFFSLVGVVSKQKTSIYVNWLNGIFTSIAGFFFRMATTDKNKEKSHWKKDMDIVHIAKLIGIPLGFIVIFVLLYKNGNPLFNDWVNSIHFNFINLQWLFFTILGYYLFQNISKPVLVEPATSRDLDTKNELHKSGELSEVRLKKEKQLGTTLLGLLNLLILLYIATDITSLISMTDLRAPALSDQVHNGINTLIASIVIAIFIILYFFRGNLNFYTGNKVLKQLTYVWIVLNVVLVVLIAIKNQNYILTYGLTYKRIGVHIYILLTLVGLITTFLKVLSIKNMTFLFRMNTQIAFIVLIVLSTINWDRTITLYNISSAANFDIDYLIKLSNGNAILLHDEKDNMVISQHNKNRINTKYKQYIHELSDRDWQEWNYDLFILKNRLEK